jgi:outer membrane immunogenic protein
VLIFATAGGAGGSINTSAPTFTSTSSSEFGWTAGGGLEFGITDNVTAKIDYLYVDLQNGSFNCPATTCSGTATAITGNASFTTSVVRAGLNLKFNPF